MFNIVVQHLPVNFTFPLSSLLTINYGGKFQPENITSKVQTTSHHHLLWLVIQLIQMSYCGQETWTVQSRCHLTDMTLWHVGCGVSIGLILHEIDMTLYDATIKATDDKNCIAGAKLEFPQLYHHHVVISCWNLFLTIFDREGPGSHISQRNQSGSSDQHIIIIPPTHLWLFCSLHWMNEANLS